ncbi:MAG: glucose-1-phosphate adenylyltransferase [Bacteroidetes bacterium]|nr:MAG: glucose-1-phosphate adenylyltransferase [Bacteroidota bacterium]
MAKRSRVVCLILGGGVGTRLFPLTAHRSKPAVPIAGKYRLIDIPISNCLNSGFTKMLVLTQYNSASLNNHIKHTYQFDLFSKGFVDIFAAEQTFSNQDWFQGTADAVRKVLPRLSRMDYDHIMILSGDQLYQMNLREFFDTHIKQNADLSIATIPVDASDAPGFGIMKVDADGMINNFIEKPEPSILPEWTSEVSEDNQEQGKEYLASMGIYLFKYSLLVEMLEGNPLEHDFGKGIIPICISNKQRVVSHPFNGYWSDIGTIKSFFDANLSLTDHMPRFNLFDNEMIVYSRARMLSPTKLFGTKCDQVLIADGCIIHAELLKHTIIGVRSRIGVGAVLKKVYTMGQDYYQDIDEIISEDKIPMGIGDNSHIENAIIDRNCCIGRDVTIVGSPEIEDTENDTYYITDGIVVVRKGVTIPDGTRIGV